MTDERPALSLNQKFLCSLDHGETAGALSHWYTITSGLRLRGNLDVGALSAALDDVVARHEILRTVLREDDGGWYQRPHPPAPVSVETRRAGLPAARQYREFAEWQRAAGASWSGIADGYWRDRLRGARLHALPASRVLHEGAPDPYSVHRFVIGRELTEAAARLGRSTRSSLFVVLLAAHNLLASQLPIRTDVGRCGSFADVITRTRASCLQAYANDIPFPLIQAQAGDLMEPCGDDHLAVCAFEMFPPPVLGGIERTGDIRYTELRGKRTSRSVGASTPKGMLWAVDHLRSGELPAVIRFSRDRVDAGAIAGIATQYRQVLSASVAEPGRQLVRS